MPALTRNKGLTIRYLFLLLTTLCTSSCSLVNPLEESPAPHAQKVEKSFFVKEVVQKDGTVTQIPRSFACAWAPVAEAGELSDYVLHGLPSSRSGSCNIHFDIEEGNLIGKLVDPVKSPKEWKTIIVIPIQYHYNLENAKDSYGRDTNDIIENQVLHHWSRRSSMKLKLEGLQIPDQQSNLLLNQSPNVTSVEDVEMSQHKGKNYWAFTVNVLSKSYGSSLQAKYRFNFLEFEHDKDFKPIAYDLENSKKLNALYVIGKMLEGRHINYTVRWKIEDSPIDICLYGFPSEGFFQAINYKQVARDSIKDWNDLIEQVHGAGARPFNVIDSPSYQRYSLDLRCSTITWVKDKNKTRVPLGVASVNSDVRNGKILWSHIVIYGGVLESYVKRYTSSDFASSLAKAVASIFSRNDDQDSSTNNSLQVLPLSNGVRFQLLSDNPESNEVDELSRWLDSAAEKDSHPNNESSSGSTDWLAHQIIQNFNIEIAKDKADRDAKLTALSGSYFSSPFGSNGPSNMEDFHRKSTFLGFDKHTWRSDNDATKLYHTKEEERLNHVFDENRTIEELVPYFSDASVSNITYEDKMRNMVKSIISHEFGHTLGMGHNFKSSILPKEGSIPEKHYLVLKDNAEKYQSAQTTVMGYTSPQIDLAMDYNEIKPAIHDYMVMHYLYRGEYPVWSGNKEDDFEFYAVPSDGHIPDKVTIEGKELKTTYLPSCDNWHQFMYHDPYCDMYLKGSNAREIVKSKFDRLTENWIRKMNNFAAGSRLTPWAADSYLAFQSFTTFSRIRIFYEYMTEKYEDEILQVIHLNPRLGNFYKTCKAIVNGKEGDLMDTSLLNIFKNTDREFTDLCYVNGYAIERMSGILQLEGPDFTTVDHDNMSSSVATIRIGDKEPQPKIGGSWTRRGLLPAKYAALFTLTNPFPYGIGRSGSLSGKLFPIYRYARQGAEYRRLYSSLYPEEYTEAIASTVVNNLSFKDIFGNGEHTIKRSVILLGALLQRSNFNNEAQHGFSADHLQDIANQTKISGAEYSLVLLRGKKSENNRDRINSFEATLYIPSLNEMLTLADAYILPGGKVFFRQNESNSFLYPLTPIRFFSNELGMVLVLRVTFDDSKDPDSNLSSRSVKIALKEKYEMLMDNCLLGTTKNGVKNGLEDYFQDPNFSGYFIPENIADTEGINELFLSSVDNIFDDYVKSDKYRDNPPRKETCGESLNAIGLIVSTALSLQGVWLREILNYIIF